MDDQQSGSSDLPPQEGGYRQVKSKKRVADHGEVFTSPREVNAMLDLVKDETEHIDSRFLEPACGDGNFLIEILRRKMDIVEAPPCKSLTEYECAACQAVSSLYGIEILEDNVQACRDRLYKYVEGRYLKAFPDRKSTAPHNPFLKSVSYLLSRNIVWGDALSYLTVDAHPHPIVFSQWTFCDSMVTRCDYQFNFLVEKEHQYSLFDEQGDVQQFDDPVREFNPVHYTKLSRYGD